METILDQIELPESIKGEKLSFLQNAITGAQNLNRNQLIPYFTSLIRKANEENIHFSDEEVRFVILAIKAASTPEQNKSIDQLLHGK